MLNQYLDSGIENLPDRSNLSSITHYYNQMVPLCIKVSVGSGLTDLLFGRIWDTFSEDAISKGGVLLPEFEINLWVRFVCMKNVRITYCLFFNPWSPVGSFTNQKMSISCPISVFYGSTDVWLPASSKESDSVATFRSKLKTFMFARAFDLTDRSVNEGYRL